MFKRIFWLPNFKQFPEIVYHVTCTGPYNFSCFSAPPNMASPFLSLTHTNTQWAWVFGSLSSPMASSQKLTEYERRRLENIRRNEEIMAALRIYSKATQLFSTSSKRQRSLSQFHFPWKYFLCNNSSKKPKPIIIFV